jgi:hypothetical protein
MKSEFFQDFGIPLAECEIESRLDHRGVPQLWFKSTHLPEVSLDLATARQLQLLLVYAGELEHADEIARHLEKVTRPGSVKPGPAGAPGLSKRRPLRGLQSGNSQRVFKPHRIAERLLLVAAVAIACHIGIASAQEPPAAINITQETENLAGTRRQILARAFADTGVTVEWFDKSFADEVIKSDNETSPQAMVSQVLARANFVIAYDMRESEPRITRILVLGRGLPSAKAAELQVRFGAQRRHRRVHASASASDTAARQQVEQARAKALERMQATAAAVRKRTSELGANAPLLRTLAVARQPLTRASTQRGNVPVVPPPARSR